MAQYLHLEKSRQLVSIAHIERVTNKDGQVMFHVGGETIPAGITRSLAWTTALLEMARYSSAPMVRFDGKFHTSVSDFKTYANTKSSEEFADLLIRHGFNVPGDCIEAVKKFFSNLD